jgi:copper chaperone CopZ
VTWILILLFIFDNPFYAEGLLVQSPRLSKSNTNKSICFVIGLQCMEEAGCTLPMFRDLTGICNLVSSHEESGHDHMDGCAHDQIAHGDHFDCLVPLNDGSFLLSHAEGTGGGISGFIEHGRLVKVGKPLGKLQQQPRQFVDLFSYESPRRKGYESLPQTDNVLTIDGPEIVKGVKLQLDGDHTFLPSLSIGRNVVQEDMVKVAVPENFKGSGLGKTTFDVMGICCPSEVILIKRMLEPIPGVEEVSVNVTAKTVTVLHDKLWVTDGQLVKVLNEANLDASIHHRGEWKAGRKWPSPWTIASGVLLAVAFFQYLWHPLRWVAIGSVAVGIPPLIVRGVASLRRYVLDINILMLIAVGGAIGLGDYLEAGSIVFLFTLADWLESRSGDKVSIRSMEGHTD